MIACDTNVLFPALEASHPSHGLARAWLESMVEVREFALCELVLMEVYTLLRNPVVCARPLNASEAVPATPRVSRSRRNSSRSPKGDGTRSPLA
jgi:predicted nucleic acid-binding protein